MSTKSIGIGQQSIVGCNLGISVYFCTYAKKIITSKIFFIHRSIINFIYQDPMQIDLLRELIKLQKDMIIMLLSMLEGNRNTSFF
jgi:hypothetical protein